MQWHLLSSVISYYWIFSENERVEYEEPADKRRRSDLVKNHAEVKEEPIDDEYGSQNSQRINSNEDRSQKQNLLSKKEKELQEQKEQYLKWKKEGDEWNRKATEWYISNNIELVTEDNEELWKEKQKYLKFKNKTENKIAKYQKTIGDLEFQIEKLKTSLSFWRILGFILDFTAFLHKFHFKSERLQFKTSKLSQL